MHALPSIQRYIECTKLYAVNCRAHAESVDQMPARSSDYSLDLILCQMYTQLLVDRACVAPQVLCNSTWGWAP